MKKLFLAICFIAMTTSIAAAKVTEVLDAAGVPEPQKEMPPSNTEVKQITEEELGEFLLERLNSTVIEDPNKVTTKAIFVEPSAETAEMKQEASKSMFQKMYDDAIKRVSGENSVAENRQDISDANPNMIDTLQQQQQEWEAPDFPVVNALLPPDGRRVVVPAKEHIPYLMNNIEILPDGMIKFDETIVVVANGEKLKNGLTKALPKFIYSRNKESQKLDYTLLSVTVNGQEIPYRTFEQDNRILLIPEDEYSLDPGIYTYNFKYVATQALWDYKDFREFYWDITGSSWGMVIARAGATITLPPAVAPLGQEVFTGYPQQLSAETVNLLHDSPETWGYAVSTPLFIGEGFHVIMSLPEDAIIPLRLTQKLLKTFDTHGDILIALAGLAAIWISFYISWKYIKISKGQLKLNLKKNGIMLRYLAFNRFDLMAIGSFLLELYRKNLIDIQQADDTILLIKRTDNLNSLSKLEKKAVNQLFTNNEAVLNVNKSNFLKIKRAAEYLEKDLHGKLTRFIVKLNLGYLFFSLGMLVLTELFISFLKINILQTWAYLSIGTAVMIIGIWIFNRKAVKLWSKIAGKTVGILLCGLSFVALSGLISSWAVLCILTSVILISRYTAIYSKRNGLLRDQINEAQKIRDYLLMHRENILTGREIISQQPNIAALGLMEEFTESPFPQNEYNKLKEINALIKKLST